MAAFTFDSDEEDEEEHEKGTKEGTEETAEEEEYNFEAELYEFKQGIVEGVDLGQFVRGWILRGS